MKLSRVYENIDDIPDNLRDYYIADENNRYVLQVEGMVAKKELREFRNNNVQLIKEKKQLEERIKELETNQIEHSTPEIEDTLSGDDIKSDEQQYLERVVNTYRKSSVLRNVQPPENTLYSENIDADNFVIDTTHIRIGGRFIRTAQLRSESYVDIKDPEILIDLLQRENKGIDIFTFISPLTDLETAYEAKKDTDNLAVIPITTYDDWWNKQIKDKTRNLVRKAAKNNVSVKKVPLDDELITGIHGIFNETPLRQGRPYPHYGKSFDRVKEEISTFSDTSDFIGAYLDGELIGFIKIVYNDRCASLMQIISMLKHRDKALMNAMVAKTVEVCAEKKIEFLIYRKFVYGKKGIDELTKFKINNGFQRFDITRYYVPLTLKGKVAMALGVHKGVTELIPAPVYVKMVKLRNSFYQKRRS